MVIASTPTTTGSSAATRAPNATTRTTRVSGSARRSPRSVSSVLMVRTSWSRAGKPVSLTSKPSASGACARASWIVERRSGTTLLLMSLVNSGVRAAMRKVVRRSLLTKLDSPIERTEITWLTYGRRSAATFSVSSTTSKRRFVQRTGPRTTMAT